MPEYTLQQETLTAIGTLTLGTVAEESMRFGKINNEPLLIAMDCMLRYAKAYARAYGTAVGADGVLGREFVRVIQGVRGLLNGNGAVAMERNITTDSKDNGVIESLYWTICDVAGVDGDR